MSHVLQNGDSNRLLASLAPEDAGSLIAVGRIEYPPKGRVLTRNLDPGTEVWFPHTGAIALVTTDASGRSVQTGLVGPEGCVGLESLFGARRAVPDAVVQIEGAISVIPVAHLRAALDSRPQVQIALATFLYGLAAQSLQNIACNRLHSLGSRCCRWLLTMHDKTGGDDILITQENLAVLLGGGRPRVNALLADLEKDGILRRHRGRIRLLSRPGLEDRTCECYQVIREVRRSLHSS